MSFLDMMSGYMMMLPQELTSEIMPVYRRTVALVNVAMDEMIRVLESMYYIILILIYHQF